MAAPHHSNGADDEQPSADNPNTHPPNTVDPVRFTLLREDEIVGLGCSFPFPHDEIVVTQTETTATVDSLAAARDVTDADTVRFYDADLPVGPTDDDWLAPADATRDPDQL